MNTCYFFSILFALLISTNSAAADYLLRIETVEVRDLPNGAQEPDMGTREIIEILVHSGKGFYGSTMKGTHRVQVKGKLEEAKDGTQRVQMSYRRSSASDEMVPGVHGERLPVSNAIEMKTDVISVQLGKPVEFDTNVSRTRKMRTTLVVQNYDSSRSPD